MTAEVTSTTNVSENWSTRLRGLLANLYLHTCNLPDCISVIDIIATTSPRKHSDGTLTLVYLFTMLEKESTMLRKTIEGTEHVRSKCLTKIFGSGEVAKEHCCPIKAVVKHIVESDYLLIHHDMIHLLDFLHGVMLFNDVTVHRVLAVHYVVVQVRQYYVLRCDEEGRCSGCIECEEDAKFIAKMFEFFVVMESDDLLKREYAYDKRLDRTVMAYANSLKIVSTPLVNDCDFDTKPCDCADYEASGECHCPK